MQKSIKNLKFQKVPAAKMYKKFQKITKNPKCLKNTTIKDTIFRKYYFEKVPINLETHHHIPKIQKSKKQKKLICDKNLRNVAKMVKRIKIAKIKKKNIKSIKNL